MPGTKINEKPVSQFLILEGYLNALTFYHEGVTHEKSNRKFMEKLEWIKEREKIVLCLNDDEAGVYAVESLCNGQSS